MTITEQAREGARNKTTGRFGEWPRIDAGQIDLNGVSDFTDDAGVAWISAPAYDPRQASARAVLHAERITQAGKVAWVRSRILGDEAEFEVRDFDAAAEAVEFSASQGFTYAADRGESALDTYDPDGGPDGARIYLPLGPAA